MKVASIRREDVLSEVGTEREWDFIIVGGGATGLGAAVEAASRGFRTLLLEAKDFAKATSSRSTKLVHGGVRYLEQGNVKLVLEALRERGRILRNAPHLAHRRAFVIPAYALWQLPFYGAGLTLYDLLAGREAIGRSAILSAKTVVQELPTVRKSGLKGGIRYYDGQFDDARFAITLLRTLFDLGAVAVNYAPVINLLKRNGTVCGIAAMDDETGTTFECSAKVVINATGIFSDSLRCMDDPQVKPVIAVSQGTHIVLPREFLPSASALMIPKTSDGRVLFAIPWHDRVVVGTTDDPVPRPEYDPHPTADERKFLLAHIERFLGRPPQDGDIRSIWSGQRPLVRQADTANTAALSRDHTILISPSKLVTITGGKWTTYRKMAEDVINRAAPLAGLPHVASRTSDLRLHGWTTKPAARNEWECVYGSDLPFLQSLAEENVEFDEFLHPALPFRKAEIVWAARHEMARTVEDVLARRTRALFLDAAASMESAPVTARLLAGELGHNNTWARDQVQSFRKLAEAYTWKLL
jgi:glycerol-3-phosphate dehydrogenase